MISRVAECCFWLYRYMERVENMARLLRVNRSLVPDGSLPTPSRWRPMIIVAGEEERFTELFGADKIDDGEAVQRYLTWDERCPVAILTSLRWARENARTIRETISLEMWETLNTFWLWMEGGKARYRFRNKRDEFYAQIKETCLLFHGVCHNTVLHEEAFDFMRLGMLLERAAQTGRILDVHHHALKPNASELVLPSMTAQWLSILRSCSAVEALLKKSRAPLSGIAVAEFLMLKESFPRSIKYCISRAWNFLGRIRPEPDSVVGKRSFAMLRQLVDHVAVLTMDKILEPGIHEELTYLIDWTSEVCGAIHADYFDLTSVSLAEEELSFGSKT